MSKDAATTIDREFRFERAHFEVLRSLARAEAGIELNDSKHELIYGRLARRIRELQLPGFDEYCQLVTPQGSAERANFINCITTNFTSFFREPHHFEFLRYEALPTLMKRRSASRRLRIWSSASSTGQEPYSIAITLAEALPPSPSWDCRLLATDIDSNVISQAEAGVYRRSELAGLTPAQERWFLPVPGSDPPEVRADEQLRKMSYFRILNLMEPWPMKGPLDVIFCRNVIIYFSEQTQRRLIERFAQILAPDGYLFIGHSESILHSTETFEAVGRTIYRLRGAPS